MKHKMTFKTIYIISALTVLLCVSCGLASAEIKTAALTGEYTDFGTDIDGDGLYDFLTIEVGVSVRNQDEYSIMAFLFDPEEREVTWTGDHNRLSPGNHTMHLEFEAGSIAENGWIGSYKLRKLVLASGDSDTGMEICDYVFEPYTTSSYNASDFTSSVVDSSEDGGELQLELYPDDLKGAIPLEKLDKGKEKIISGNGSGELLLTFQVKNTIPVLDGMYSYDVVDINIPPISTPFKVICLPGLGGRIYDIPNVTMAAKPNNFSVGAEKVKNLNIGLKKLQGERTRIWFTTQIDASEDGIAITESDLISPGPYHAKIFGDAAENATQVNLTMTMVKKIIVDDRFDLGINTTGFPAGEYTIEAKALNGSFQFDEIALGGFSV